MSVATFTSNLELVGTSEYLYSALNIRAQVAGSSGSWAAKVVGDDPETGQQVGVAWWDPSVEKAAEAKAYAAKVFAYVKKLRKDAESPGHKHDLLKCFTAAGTLICGGR